MFDRFLNKLEAAPIMIPAVMIPNDNDTQSGETK